MGLVFLVDDGSGGLEALPNALAEFLCHGAELLPLLVEFLQVVESGDHVLVLRQLFGSLAELDLGLEVLLEVEVAQLVGDLHLVVKALHVELIVVVEIAEIAGRNGADASPAVLKGAERREQGAYVLLAVHQCLEFLHYGFLLFQILSLLGILNPVVFGALALVVCIKGLEVLFDGIEGVVDYASGLAADLAEGAVEGRFDVFGFLAAGHAVFAVHKVFEDCAELGYGLADKGCGIGLYGFFLFNFLIERFCRSSFYRGCRLLDRLLLHCLLFR